MPYIEDILAETGDAAFDPATDILEMFEVGGTQPGGGDTVSLESAEKTLVYLIDWRKARGFTRSCLGLAYADNGPPYRLRRENPWLHPRFPKCYAATIHFSSVAPKANDEGTGSPEANSPNYPAIFADETLTKTAYYDKCYCTVRFTRRDYDIRPDASVTSPVDELRRNCVITPTPVIELLTAEGGVSQLSFSEGSGVAPQPTIGMVINNSFAIRVAKVRLIVEWFGVPENYLSSDPDMFFPRKLFDCIGKVNSVPFLGRPAGTLLMDTPKMQRFQYPVGTFDGLGGFFGWNLQIPLTYFNPTLGVEDTDETDNNKARGHRCVPHAASTAWWGAKREDTSNPLRQWLLEETDFNTMLEHIDQ